MDAINYAAGYQQGLEQAFPYSLYYGALYKTENNGRFKWSGANKIEIASLATTGRVDADRDSISGALRNYTNQWITKELTNRRKWSTLVHPSDIDQTNQAASISNITQVYNNEHKFPEMDAYCISKIYADWTATGREAGVTVLTKNNVLSVIDGMKKEMDKKRVPRDGRVLYITADVAGLLRDSAEISKTIVSDAQNGVISREISMIDGVALEVVPDELLKTAYDFDEDWAASDDAAQINIAMIYTGAVITPVSYQFSRLDEPSALTEGKYVYFEESFEDVFILENKADGIQFNITKKLGA